MSNASAVYIYEDKIKRFNKQLSTLSLNMNMDHMFICEDGLFPSFPNVKFLNLRVVVENHEKLLSLVGIIAKACPLLDELKLEVIWWCDCTSDFELSDIDSASESDSASENDDSNSVDDSVPENNLDPECNLDYVKHWLETPEVSNATLPKLRKFTWINAFSHHEDLEVPLMLHILKNAVVLEKLICEPRGLYGRQRARKLAVVIPSQGLSLTVFCKRIVSRVAVRLCRVMYIS
ncbi:uncharacterized protein LOC104887554 isoform X4 [Beta vulgaris subsp. vulgaris]|uniref:uncharacterized protein LOC104887554 isoform X4 n=1 Tax=Beta vulgaris subsp. vulgaris TaxID=3555 RepID=UPI0020369341|nr:uncharacterized protein LOC104887554 isoform X4 [Beta vulgaris subsp. vulgaris]